MQIYDSIGGTYSIGRRSDPRIASALASALSGAETILNIGAGTGSYEPRASGVVAAEPSMSMLRQRPRDATPAIQCCAEQLPFADGTFSHGLAILTMHHWSDRSRAFDAIARVVRMRFVALVWDPEADPFWLTRDYFPEIHAIDRAIFPAIEELADSFESVRVEVLEVPSDCIDGFAGAYWKRPHAYLDPGVRANMSTFTKLKGVEAGVESLRSDLASGRWQERNHALIDLASMDLGYRIVTVSV